MSDLFDINSHLALAISESYVSPSERAWLKWVASVEKLLGHDLDGDQDRDGYSLDFANDFFEDGFSPAEYALEVADRKADRAPC